MELELRPSKHRLFPERVEKQAASAQKSPSPSALDPSTWDVTLLWFGGLNQPIHQIGDPWTLSLSLSPFSYTFTSVLVLGQGYSYSRTNNPTVTVLEEKLAKLENGCGTCVRSP